MFFIFEPRAQQASAHFFGTLGVKNAPQRGRLLKLTVLRGGKYVMENGWVDGDDIQTHTRGQMRGLTLFFFVVMCDSTPFTFQNELLLFHLCYGRLFLCFCGVPKSQRGLVGRLFNRKGAPLLRPKTDMGIRVRRHSVKR